MSVAPLYVYVYVYSYRLAGVTLEASVLQFESMVN